MGSDLESTIILKDMKGVYLSMEQNDAPVKGRYGLQRFGFVTNMKGGAYLKDLQDLLNETDYDPTSQDIRERAENARVLLLNRHGYEKSKNGRFVTEDSARYKAFDTGYILDGEAVYGWFERNEAGRFDGVTWGTLRTLRAYAQLKNKKAYLFKMGDLCFETFEDCQAFLDGLAQATIPESWKYKNKTSSFSQPILRSYLDTVFVKLKKEGKVLKSKDGKYVIFNTNLLDRFFQDIYIIAEVESAEDIELYSNPIRTSSQSYRDLKMYGFEGMTPQPPAFFDDVHEVIFNPVWDIDKNYESLTHIIDQRKERFPADMKDQDSYNLARKLYDAIDFAVSIAQRNYKYIVPIYYPRFDKISFLMPIFLHGTYNTSPDFALVLQADPEHQMYIARTILDLETGYQNARLIAKPDESWLNPVTLK